MNKIKIELTEDQAETLDVILKESREYVPTGIREYSLRKGPKNAFIQRIRTKLAKAKN